MTAQSLFARLPLAEQKRRLAWMEAGREAGEAARAVEDAAREMAARPGRANLMKLRSAIGMLDAARLRMRLLQEEDGDGTE